MATLGPQGTDAHCEAQRHFADVLLADSFELAMQVAIASRCHAMVAAGWVERGGPDAGVSDLWVNLHFRYLGKAELVGMWQAPTKPMCLATAASVQWPRTVALHPATDVFADLYAPSASRHYVDAKPLAVRQVTEGRTEACIGSVDVVQQAGLTIRAQWQPTMAWFLYQPVNPGGPDLRHISG
ncbi:hypothetical protein AB0C52_23930 [Streptomyces sp. NPDC048717]|uniref:hypothetical protein n=1 Tax=Streptomyces sp. NPDC048717 TaxID=3154928 RepID=UPI00341D7037